MQGFNWNHQRFDKWVKQLSVFRCTPIQIFSEYQNGKEKLWMLKMENYKISQKQLCVCVFVWENHLGKSAACPSHSAVEMENTIRWPNKYAHTWYVPLTDEKRRGGAEKR